MGARTISARGSAFLNAKSKFLQNKELEEMIHPVHGECSLATGAFSQAGMLSPGGFNLKF
jgi:hypothetical protein